MLKMCLEPCLVQQIMLENNKNKKFSELRLGAASNTENYNVTRTGLANNAEKYKFKICPEPGPV